MDGWWLRRRLGVLHPLGVPHHLAPRGRACRNRWGGVADVLRTAGPSLATGVDAVPSPDRPRASRRSILVYPWAPFRSGQCCAADFQLDAPHRGDELRGPVHRRTTARLTGRALLVARDRGAVLCSLAADALGDFRPQPSGEPDKRAGHRGRDVSRQRDRRTSDCVSVRTRRGVLVHLQPPRRTPGRGGPSRRGRTPASSGLDRTTHAPRRARPPCRCCVVPFWQRARILRLDAPCRHRVRLLDRRPTHAVSVTHRARITGAGCDWQGQLRPLPLSLASLRAASAAGVGAHQYQRIVGRSRPHHGHHTPLLLPPRTSDPHRKRRPATHPVRRVSGTRLATCPLPHRPVRARIP